MQRAGPQDSGVTDRSLEQSTTALMLPRGQGSEDRGALSSPVLRPPISVLCLPSRRPGGYGEGPNTRSHPELGREIPQRQWYCVLRRGRVGRRQVFKTEVSNQKILYTDTQPTHTRPNTHPSSPRSR